MIFWFAFQILIEFTQFYFQKAKTENEEDGSWFDYFELWNILDLLRLTSQLCFILFCQHEQLEAASNAFSLVILLSWLTLINYLRLFASYRYYI